MKIAACSARPMRRAFSQWMPGCWVGTAGGAQHERAVEGLASRIGDAAEPEGLALRFGQAPELQSHKGDELRVLADGLVDRVQESAPRKLIQIGAQVPIRHGCQNFRA